MIRNASIAFVVLAILTSAVPLQAESLADSNVSWLLANHFLDGAPARAEAVVVERDGEPVETTFGAFLDEFAEWSSRGDLAALASTAGHPPPVAPVTGDLWVIAAASVCPTVTFIATGTGNTIMTPQLYLYGHDLEDVHLDPASSFVINWTLKTADAAHGFHVEGAVSVTCVTLSPGSTLSFLETNGPLWLL